MLITLLRYMQFYSHMAHNLLKGQTFFQDHEFLGELYPVYESDYDSLVERYIGLGQKVDLVEVHKKAASILENPTSYDQCYETILECEIDLCQMCKKYSANASVGFQNLLADIADRSEARQYKIKQRISKR